MNVFLKGKNGVEMTKVCSKCKEEKDVSEFYKDKKYKDGLYCWCKECNKKRSKHYRQDHKEEEKQYNKQYKREHKEEISKQKKQYNQDHKEEINQWQKQYNEKRKEETRQYNKQYKKDNKEEINQYNKQYIKERRKKDPIFKLRRNVSKSIWRCLKRFCSIKKDSCLKHLPYTIQQLYDHLEKQFDSNMSWSNYGSYWDIDHIIPQSLLPYDSMEHPNFQKCWALSNLRPLEHMENLKKGNRLIY